MRLPDYAQIMSFQGPVDEDSPCNLHIPWQSGSMVGQKKQGVLAAAFKHVWCGETLIWIKPCDGVHICTEWRAAMCYNSTYSVRRKPSSSLPPLSSCLLLGGGWKIGRSGPSHHVWNRAAATSQKRR